MIKFVLLSFLLSLSHSALSKEKCALIVDKKICISLSFPDGLSRKPDSLFTMSFSDIKSHVKIPINSLPKMELWMVMKGGHGHGSDPLKITKKSKGHFLFKNAWFMMLGEWFIKGSFTYAKKTYQVKIPVCVKKDSKKSFIGKCKKDA